MYPGTKVVLGVELGAQLLFVTALFSAGSLGEEAEVSITRALEAKYLQLDKLGEGGCGSVFAGYRKADYLPENIICQHVDDDGKELSAEVVIMLKLAAESKGTSAPVSLLDWYDLDQELILVLERPIPAEDLYDYIKVNGGSLDEEEAKIILKQLVEAAIYLEKNHIFHRDIKSENILIESSSDVLRVRLIDFGLSCFGEREDSYHIFYDCQDLLQTCLKVNPDHRPTLKQLSSHPWLQ
ncbi:serine/threonine-protein kinase pim-1-like [Anarhichas minor]|uniref:serine/threonine-protein kinase pim-1-like n=1 Tax=Anarhichas minor TaxID=65739 RepID=UPI003F738795